MLFPIILILLLIAYQDFKERAVYVWIFPVLSGLFLTKNFIEIPYSTYLFNTGINLGFCLIQYFVLTLYFSIKNKQLINIADQLIGWGDIVFALVLCVAFPPLTFFCYYLLSLIIAALIGLYFKSQNKTIPLAGIQAIVLIIWIIIINFIIRFSINDDAWIIEFLI